MFYWLTTMQVRGSSLHLREATAIRIGLAQLGFPYHMTYVGPRPTYINLHSDPPKRELVCATWEHSTPPPCATPGGSTGCVHATLTISHTRCTVVFSHKSLDHMVSYNSKVLNRHRRDDAQQALPVGLPTRDISHVSYQDITNIPYGDITMSRPYLNLDI